MYSKIYMHIVETKSEIVRHAKTGHKINWKKPQIVDVKSNYKSRLFSEMAYIHLNQNTLNNIKDRYGASAI